MIIPRSRKSDELEDADLEQRMAMVVNGSVWRPVIAFVIAFATLFAVSDTLAFLNSKNASATETPPIQSERGFAYWLKIALNTAPPAMVGITALVTMRNRYNSKYRNAFSICLVIVCVAVPLRVGFTSGTLARFTASSAALLFSLASATCLYLERQYVNEAEAEVDRRLEELGYDEF